MEGFDETRNKGLKTKTRPFDPLAGYRQVVSVIAVFSNLIKNLGVLILLGIVIKNFEMRKP